MAETTSLTETHPETVERPCADQVAEGRLEQTEPRSGGPKERHEAQAVVVEETKAKETETRAVRWFEMEAAPEAEREEPKADVKRETKRWFEGYRAGYFC